MFRQKSPKQKRRKENEVKALEIFPTETDLLYLYGAKKIDNVN